MVLSNQESQHDTGVYLLRCTTQLYVTRPWLGNPLTMGHVYTLVEWLSSAWLPLYRHLYFGSLQVLCAVGAWETLSGITPSEMTNDHGESNAILSLGCP